MKFSVMYFVKETHPFDKSRNGFFMALNKSYLLNDGSFVENGNGKELMLFSSEEEAKKYLATHVQKARIRFITGKEDLCHYKYGTVKVLENIYKLELSLISHKELYELAKMPTTEILNIKLGFTDDDYIYTFGKIHDSQIQVKGYYGEYHLI